MSTEPNKLLIPPRLPAMKPEPRILMHLILPGPVIFISGMLALTGPAAGQNPGNHQGGFSERISDTGLRALQKRKPTCTSIAPPKPTRNPGIVETSDFIAFDGCSSLVPKGAILHVPEQFSANIAAGPTGKILLWSDFLNLNRARIYSFEISLEEAAGRKSIDTKRLESAIKTGQLVVAVIRGCPTSVFKPDKALPATDEDDKSTH
jgi:hypothetical protein